MPRFAANLSMMFTEAPFIERFAAAAEAGFQAVEFLFPYDFAASEIKAQLSRHNLTLALFNTSAGDTAAGEWGRAALPGREHDARADIDLALEYALALECEQVHIMAASCRMALMAHVIAPRLSIICVMPPTGLPPTINVF